MSGKVKRIHAGDAKGYAARFDVAGNLCVTAGVRTGGKVQFTISASPGTGSNDEWSLDKHVYFLEDVSNNDLREFAQIILASVPPMPEPGDRVHVVYFDEDTNIKMSNVSASGDFWGAEDVRKGKAYVEILPERE